MIGQSQIAKSQAWFSGLEAYVSSEGSEPIYAQVELTEISWRPAAFPLLVTGGASRLFSTLRTEPRYIEAFVDLVENVHGGLAGAEDPSAFRVDSCVGDPTILALGGDRFLADAEVSGVVPILEHQLSGPAEASAAMTLRIRKRSGPSVMLTFHGGPKNALISIAAWAATIDECARTQPPQEFVPPTLRGLAAIKEIWDIAGNPKGLREGREVEQLIAAETLAGVP